MMLSSVCGAHFRDDCQACQSAKASNDDRLTRIQPADDAVVERVVFTGEGARVAIAQMLSGDRTVERVARAIHEALIPLEQDSPSSQEYAHRLARAAIAALASPQVNQEGEEV